MRLVFASGEPHLEPNPGRHLMNGVPDLAANTLDRHSGRVLRPAEAIRAPSQPMPVGTIYRYDRVLVDESLIEDGEAFDRLTDAIAHSGLRLVHESASAVVPGQRSRRVTVALGGNPTSVDSWHLVQSLKTAAAEGRLDADLADKVRLEHLMVCSRNGPGSAEAEPPFPGRRSSLGRIPVDMLNPMPDRQKLDRRIRVAVLDTGVPREHPAFDVSDRNQHQDTFVVVDHEFQEYLATAADSLAGPLGTPWEGPVHEPTLNNEVASHFGHGTFMTGLLRQVAPDVQVYSLRVVHNDGMAYEHEVIAALHHVADQVEADRGGDPEAFGVDMVVLAVGYVDEDPNDEAGGWLGTAIERLTRLGVTVVAAAGNQSSDRPFYPAAYAAHPRPDTSAPVLSVAALNPNRNVAMFSNDGSWISCYAIGAGLVSTYPCEARGGRMPEWQSKAPLGRFRESPDPDDFYAGYAIWSGTSFAAPIAAAYLANEMMDSGVPAAAVEDPAQASAWVHGAIKRLKSR